MQDIFSVFTRISSYFLKAMSMPKGGGGGEGCEQRGGEQIQGKGKGSSGFHAFQPTPLLNLTIL